ncbi:predicted protein [Postia placenta Mad-698-R]|nr:predicted protein [Postia placenta Mad-698-R]
MVSNVGSRRTRKKQAVTIRPNERVRIEKKITFEESERDEEEFSIDDDPAAGIDDGDRNQVHLQAALAAQSVGKTSTRTDTTAQIPIPTCEGIVVNYEEMYTSPWSDPDTYLEFSDTVEQSISFAFFGGGVYYMDECDKEWLHGVNAEISRNKRRSAMRTTRSASDITEDEFEFIMAWFEWSATSKENPNFVPDSQPLISSDSGVSMEDTGASLKWNINDEWLKDRLSPITKFASSKIPNWIYSLRSERVLHLGQTLYPHWHRRRLEKITQAYRKHATVDEEQTLVATLWWQGYKGVGI